MELKDRLKILREEKGWNKTEAAKKMGVSVGAYSNWEYGNRIPDYQNLKDLSELFEVSVLYLREGEKTFLDMSEEEAKEYLGLIDYNNHGQGLLSAFEIADDAIFGILYDRINTLNLKELSHNERRLLFSTLLLIDFQNKAEFHTDEISANLADLIEHIYVQDKSSRIWEDRSILLDRKYKDLKHWTKKFYEENNPS